MVKPTNLFTHDCVEFGLQLFLSYPKYNRLKDVNSVEPVLPLGLAAETPKSAPAYSLATQLGLLKK